MSRQQFSMDDVVRSIREAFQAKHEAREAALRPCRPVIQHSANAIRAIHRHDFETARSLIAQARALLQEVSRILERHQDIFHAGFVHDSQKEYAEASITLALITRSPLPDWRSLDVEPAAYANGLGEAAGEVRRYVLDSLRRGDAEGCEELLEAMDEVYTALVTMDFPDAITGGLRRTTDMVRGVLERTRGDLTLALQQRRLERLLQERGGR